MLKTSAHDFPMGSDSLAGSISSAALRGRSLHTRRCSSRSLGQTTAVVLLGNPQRNGISEVKSSHHTVYKVDFGPFKPGAGVESALCTEAKSPKAREPGLTGHPVRPASMPEDSEHR